MSLIKFMYPISDSGIYFEFELVEITKEVIQNEVSLRIKYSLKDIESKRFKIPITISECVYLDGVTEIDIPLK